MDLVSQMDWEKQGGLLPAIVQDSQTGRVLMLAFMNRAALERTLSTGMATFWSRSREALWTKGETSGNLLRVRQVRPDCDNDSLLVIAQPTGPACHGGTVSCFGRDDEFAGLEFLGALEKLVLDRKKNLPENSYTASLFKAGATEIGKKLGEEAVELILTAVQSRDRTLEEAADLLYHLLVFLAERDIPLREAVLELESRYKQSTTMERSQS